MTLDTQFLTMISMVVGGIYLGFANDTYRRVSVRWKHKSLLVYLFEISFWLIQTAILFYVLYRVNHGEIRFYIFLAIFLGISMYVVMFQSLYRRVLEIIIQMITLTAKTIVRTVEALIIAPFKWLIALCITIVTYTIYIVIKIVSFFLNIIVYPLKVTVKLIEKLLPEKFSKNVTKFIKFYSTILYKLKRAVKAFVAKRR